jgi:hypothetical protein
MRRATAKERAENGEAGTFTLAKIQPTPGDGIVLCK